MEATRLLAGAVPLGILTTTAFDHPVTYADFVPSEEFSDYRNLFEELVLAIREGGACLDSARKTIDDLDLALEFAPGSVERISIIIIDGTKARWRAGALRSVQRNHRLAFWKTLGSEIGPEKCRKEGCSKPRISESVFCRRHHFLMIEGTECTGPEDV